MGSAFRWTCFEECLSAGLQFVAIDQHEIEKIRSSFLLRTHKSRCTRASSDAANSNVIDKPREADSNQFQTVERADSSQLGVTLSSRRFLGAYSEDRMDAGETGCGDFLECLTCHMWPKMITHVPKASHSNIRSTLIEKRTANYEGENDDTRGLNNSTDRVLLKRNHSSESVNGSTFSSETQLNSPDTADISSSCNESECLEYESPEFVTCSSGIDNITHCDPDIITTEGCRTSLDEKLSTASVSTPPLVRRGYFTLPGDDLNSDVHTTRLFETRANEDSIATQISHCTSVDNCESPVQQTETEMEQFENLMRRMKQANKQANTLPDVERRKRAEKLTLEMMNLLKLDEDGNLS